MGNAQDGLGGLAEQTGNTAPTAPLALHRPVVDLGDDDPYDTGNPNLADTPRKAAEHGFFFKRGMPSK